MHPRESTFPWEVDGVFANFRGTSTGIPYLIAVELSETKHCRGTWAGNIILLRKLRTGNKTLPWTAYRARHLPRAARGTTDIVGTARLWDLRISLPLGAASSWVLVLATQITDTWGIEPNFETLCFPIMRR